MPQLSHLGRGWYVAAQHRGRRSHHFVITCSGAICTGTTIYCSTSASQGGHNPGVCEPDVFRSFQLAAAYWLTCSEDSSERVYDPTRECFMAELADGAIKEASSDNENGSEHPPANQVVAHPANWGAVSPPNPATSSSSVSRQVQWRNTRSFRKSSRRSVGRHDCCILRLSRSAPRVVRGLKR